MCEATAALYTTLHSHHHRLPILGTCNGRIFAFETKHKSDTKTEPLLSQIGGSLHAWNKLGIQLYRHFTIVSFGSTFITSNFTAR